MPIQFDRPGWLLLVLLVVPVIFMAARGLRRKRGRGRALGNRPVRSRIAVGDGDGSPHLGANGSRDKFDCVAGPQPLHSSRNAG